MSLALLPVAALLGLVFGSLASALSFRLPRGLPVFADRSRCTACGTALGPRDLVPVLSWLAARGRCRHCGAPVSRRYPLIELTTALLFGADWLLAAPSLALWVVLAGVSCLLMVIIVADLEERIIPDAALLALLPLAGLWRLLLGGGWLDPLLGAAFGLLLSFGLRWAFLRLRGKEALGLGDVKFLAVAGLFIGVQPFGRFLVVAGLCGLLFGVLWRRSGRGPAFPFGPALCAALAIELWLAAPLLSQRVVALP
jgi:leader peptidase (prepilin peptidase)/N-methyltransferase